MFCTVKYSYCCDAVLFRSSVRSGWLVENGLSTLFNCVVCKMSITNDYDWRTIAGDESEI